MVQHGLGTIRSATRHFVLGNNASVQYNMFKGSRAKRNSRALGADLRILMTSSAGRRTPSLDKNPAGGPPDDYDHPNWLNWDSIAFGGLDKAAGYVIVTSA